MIVPMKLAPENPRTPEIGVVVSRDRAVRELVIEALHAEGIGTLVCPGPCGPGWTCLGDQEGGCPFVGTASVVVVDTPTQGDLYDEGTPSWVLVDRYLAAGMHTVVLQAGSDELAVDTDDVQVVRKPLLEDNVRAAVRTRRRKS